MSLPFMTVPVSSTALAERNTRPSVPSDESTRHKLNGLLCVDALNGEEFLRLSAKRQERGCVALFSRVVPRLY